MSTILLVIHLLLAIALVSVVLLQRSEGGALGIGGGAGGLMTSRGSANFLTRTTALLAALFMLTSLGLTLLAGGRSPTSGIIDEVQKTQPAPAEAPAEPEGPSVPLAE